MRFVVGQLQSKHYAMPAHGLLFLLLLTWPRAVHNRPVLESADMIAPNTIRALYSIIKEYYVPGTRDFMISLHTKEQSVRWTMDHLLTLLLPQLPMIKVEIETLESKRVPASSRKFNLLLVDGYLALEEMHPAYFTLDYDINEYYLLVVVPPRDAANPVRLITDILHYFWRHYLINIGVVHEKSRFKVELFTYFPYLNAQNCNGNSIRHINDYINGTWQRSISQHIFPEKLVNLHNCPLKVAVWDTPPYLSYNPNASGVEKIGDFEGELLVELAKKMNFSMEFLEPPNDEQRGIRLANGTLTGALKMLANRTADISLGCFRYTLERTTILTAALPHYQTWQTFAVLLASRPYSSIEILAFAFDIKTWLCVCVSLQVTLLFACVVYHYSWHSQLAHIIIGFPRPTTPLINVFGSFLGAPVQQTPRNNFTRFAFILWFIYGYLLRNAYQSLLFQLLQTDMYRAPPEGIVDLIKEGYTLIMTEGTNQSVHTVPQIAQGLIRVMLSNETSELLTYEIVERMNGKFAGISPQDYLTHYVIKWNRRGVFYILPEKIFTQHISMYFTKHSYLIEHFNYLLMKLRSHGLIDYWAARELDMSYFEEPDSTEIALDALDLREMLGAFIIHFVLSLLCIVVFVCELIWWRIRTPAMIFIN